MNQESWTAADEYISQALMPADPILAECLRANAEAGLPAIDVSPLQGKFLSLLAQAHGSRRILEIGTLGGLSTILLARALPADGQLISLELNLKHAEVARSNVARAGFASQVEIIQGPALESLATLSEQGRGPFDLIFIDADKTGYPAYLDWSLRLCRPGTIILADNVVRQGRVANADDPDELVRGVRTFIDRVAAEPRLTATVLQTVGVKGHDGFLLARVLS
jgi:predicted O-methyltransferase YrrM